MIILPLKASHSTLRTPWLTLLCCIVCLAVFFIQDWNLQQLDRQASIHCHKKQSADVNLTLNALTQSQSHNACHNVLLSIATHQSPHQLIQQIANNQTTNKTEINQIKVSLTQLWQQSDLSKSTLIASKMMYYPDSLNIPTMLSSTLSHDSPTHLSGNLLFFLIFTASIEICIGSISLFFTLFCLAISTNTLYFLNSLQQATIIPTLGLSGLVYGMMGLFAFLFPKQKIQCFFWYIIGFKKLFIPSFFIISIFIVLNFYSLLTSAQYTMNHTVHFSGLIIGYAIGGLFFKEKKSSESKKLTQQKEF